VLDCLYVHGFLAWCACRIVLFITVCIVPSICTILKGMPLKSEFENEVLMFPYCFMVFMMVSLEVMHLFWTYFIIESFVAVKISSKLAKHSYD
jgi:hypothetical protein